MKFFLVFSFLILAFAANAQTVIKVSDKSATINLSESDDVAVADEVLFLRDDLSVAGSGKVTQISEEGGKALVTLTSGNAKLGMAFEKRVPSHRAKKTKASGGKKVSYDTLSEREREILQQGPISKTRYIVGGVLGTYPLGLGIGHAVQGRYLEKGWIFTVGELGSIGVMAAGLGDCWSGNSYSSCNGGLVVAGLLGFVTFRIWEIIDVWAAPPEHNRRYEELRSRLGESDITFAPAILPLADGGALGLKITF